MLYHVDVPQHKWKSGKSSTKNIKGKRKVAVPPVDVPHKFISKKKNIISWRNLEVQDRIRSSFYFTEAIEMVWLLLFCWHNDEHNSGGESDCCCFVDAMLCMIQEGNWGLMWINDKIASVTSSCTEVIPGKTVSGVWTIIFKLLVWNVQWAKLEAMSRNWKGKL